MYLTKIFHLRFGNSSIGICLSILLIPLIILFSSSNSEGLDRPYYSIHVASHKRLPNADKEILQLKKKGYDAFYKKVDIPGKGEWYRIFIGRFGNKEKAHTFAKGLKASGFSEYLTIKELIEVVTIGVIDTRKILRESKAAKMANAAYLEILKAKRAVFDSEQQKVLRIEESLGREEIGDNVSSERKDLLRLKKDLEEALRKKNKELKRGLLAEIRETVKAFSEKEKFLLLIEKKSVVVIDETVDVTDKVIDFYDAQRE